MTAVPVSLQVYLSSERCMVTDMDPSLGFGLILAAGRCAGRQRRELARVR